MTQHSHDHGKWRRAYYGEVSSQEIDTGAGLAMIEAIAVGKEVNR